MLQGPVQNGVGIQCTSKHGADVQKQAESLGRLGVEAKAAIRVEDGCLDGKLDIGLETEY
jgi:hypothetical protein